VLVDNGKITAVGTRKQVRIPENARVLDCRGMVMMAGFWNCHVHLMEPKWVGADTLPADQLGRQLEQMLTRYGFTHAFDLATLGLQNLLALRKRIDAGEVTGPTLFTAGVPFTPPGGSPFYIAPLKLPEIGTARQASEYVKRQIASGADGIKIWTASPTGKKIVPMPLEVVKEAVSMAHQLGKPIFAHPTNNAGVATAIAGGVDILVHTSPDDRQGWKEETVAGMLRGKMALIPTLKLYKWDLERTGHSTANNPLINTAVQQLSMYAKAGGQILFGTDVGFMTDYDPADEYELISAAGLSFAQTLQALTTAPAQRFGHSSHTGTVVVGMDADIVLLKTDPLLDPKSFSDVAYTIHKGKFIYRYK
jgi:imidazolonepropionase-like amidohydrolase